MGRVVTGWHRFLKDIIHEMKCEDHPGVRKKKTKNSKQNVKGWSKLLEGREIIKLMLREMPRVSNRLQNASSKIQKGKRGQVSKRLACL